MSKFRAEMKEALKKATSLYYAVPADNTPAKPLGPKISYVEHLKAETEKIQSATKSVLQQPNTVPSTVSTPTDNGTEGDNTSLGNDSET